jgi:MarR family transcriptional regulator for hemolysin
LVWYFAHLTRRYAGVLAGELAHLELDRYYYPLLLIAGAPQCLTQQDLADLLCTGKVTVVRIVDYLVRKGFVQRCHCPDDRRVHLLRATSKGEAALGDIRQAFRKLDALALQGATPEEAASFRDMLNHMLHSLAAPPAGEAYIPLTPRS